MTGIKTEDRTGNGTGEQETKRVQFIVGLYHTLNFKAP